MNKILSISVAAYNVEAYIRQALDSYVDEAILPYIEVLVTDDGSKDSTPDIVTEYEKKYPGSIRLIRQPNAGPGSTVNSGIKHATGKYFKMIDGDDWVNTSEMAGFIEFLKDCECDIVATNYCLVDNQTGQQEPQHIDGIEYNKEYSFETLDPSLTLCMHNLAIKTSIFKDNNIVLDNCFYTDTQYMLMPVPYANGIIFLDKMIYMYRVALGTQSMNINSLQKNSAMHERIIFTLADYYENYKKSGNATDGKLSYFLHRMAPIVGNQLNIFLSYKESHKAQCKDFMKRLQQKSPDIYRQFAACRTMKILTASGYTLYGLVSKLHKEK
ncbi:MAG: glycosyltransferase family 2 protein [Clostridiales bacterium]|nr:glycosyltransferase family 2 protein [Clostridiales bacterium]